MLKALQDDRRARVGLRACVAAECHSIAQRFRNIRYLTSCSGGSGMKVAPGIGV